MPTYNYKCNNCEIIFDLFQGINDKKISNCIKCHSKNSVIRLITGGTGMIFKGDGFYITDYKNNSKKKERSSNPKQSENKKENKDDKS